jgi:hypothetical protein
LTVDPLCVFQHPEQKASFAQQARLLLTILRDVRLGDDPEWKRIMQRLQETIGIRVGNVGFETAVIGLVVESVRNVISRQIMSHIAVPTQSQSPRRQTWNT